MTDQKHTKEPSVLKQIINTLMDYINKIECQRDELREALENMVVLSKLWCELLDDCYDFDTSLPFEENEQVKKARAILTKTKESV